MAYALRTYHTKPCTRLSRLSDAEARAVLSKLLLADSSRMLADWVTYHLYSPCEVAPVLCIELSPHGCAGVTDSLPHALHQACM